MRLVRSRSQSSSTLRSANFFTGLKHWRRHRRPFNTVSSSPRITSVTTNSIESLPGPIGVPRPSSHHATRSIQASHYSATSNEENESSLPAHTIFSGTNTAPTTTSITTSFAEMELIKTTRIRLLPNIELTSRGFVFDVIERILTPTTLLKIGRYSERHFMSDKLAFKSKVVSRTHAELWMKDGNKIFIRDIGSSSGTFINRVRLSRSNEVSQPMELRDGDIIQLGIDYRDGSLDTMDQRYHAVKMRLEINKDTNNSNYFSHQAFQQFCHLFSGASSSYPFSDDSNRNAGSAQLGRTNQSSNKVNGASDISEQEPGDIHHRFAFKEDDTTEKPLITNDSSTYHNAVPIQECCICLYAIAPLQALFVAPCSHGYHFKCLRPILWQHYPGFSCPMCRNYYDLEASIATEDVNQISSNIGLAALDEESTSISSKVTPTSALTSKSTGTVPISTLTTSFIAHHDSPFPANGHDRETKSTDREKQSIAMDTSSMDQNNI